MTSASETFGSIESAYAALRRGGAPPGVVRTQLALPAPTAARLEAVFRMRAARGGGEAQPKFARHAAHAAAVMAQGGFPSLTERRVGRSSMRVGLPLIWPTAETTTRVRT
ncbi:hypothetical protein [Phenylobacterium sp.]|jgi:hypothetical protein|uniref:hypothetical protein n=1 Tax=Phenylobacterium sp. TaxID=1871053 RepID=UPI002F409758